MSKKKKLKTFTIRLSQDGTRIEFHTAGSTIIPSLPLVEGTDRFNLRSNIPVIRDHIKQMMEKEGYNRVVCMDSDLVIYRELMADLEYINGLEVKRM